MPMGIEGRDGGWKRHFLGLYIRNLVSHLFAFGTIAILNLVTPFELIKVQRNFILREGGWVTFFLFFPFVLLLVGLLQYVIQRPIAGTMQRMDKYQNLPSELLKKAQKRLINLPFIIAFISLSVYFLIPALIVGSLFFFKGFPEGLCFFLYFRAVLMGMIAASLSFFLLEDHTRKALVHQLFPHGKLTDIPGTIKISIIRRIRLLNGAGTINPMLILLTTLIFLWIEVRGATVNADQLSREILIFSLVLCGIFIIIALWLNFLVGYSILHPVRDMVRVVEGVKAGDFDQRVHVVSNDEIGILGDAGNAMIRGLADREMIRETFGKYVTPEIRDQILAGKIPLNGERREATLLFSDLRDFTSYVEETSPEEVIESMRDYFTAMQSAVRKNQGLVLQYVGDEMEAVFGVPIAYKNDADRAVHAALDMRKGLQDLNRVRLAKGKPAFRHGIGVYTGMVLAGNTGSKDRLSYALIGNTVNLASRVQGLTKIFKWDILVSEETKKRLESSYSMDRAVPQRVKGYSQPITVYRLL